MRTATKATTIILTATMALTLTACGGGTTKTGALPTGTKTAATATTTPAVRPSAVPSTPPFNADGQVDPTADNPLGIDWAKMSPFTGPASDKFGAANVMIAYRHAVEFSLIQGFTDIMARGPEAKPQEFDFINPFLTANTQKVWAANVKAALANPNDRKAHAGAGSLTNWDAMYLQDVYKFRPGQTLLSVGSDFSGGTTDITADAAGEPSLRLQFTVTKSFRVMDGKNAVLIPYTKDITFNMVPNGLKEQPWLIDGWTIKPSAGKVIPDPMGATS